MSWEKKGGRMWRGEKKTNFSQSKRHFSIPSAKEAMALSPRKWAAATKLLFIFIFQHSPISCERYQALEGSVYIRSEGSRHSETIRPPDMWMNVKLIKTRSISPTLFTSSFRCWAMLLPLFNIEPIVVFVKVHSFLSRFLDSWLPTRALHGSAKPPFRIVNSSHNMNSRKNIVENTHFTGVNFSVLDMINNCGNDAFHIVCVLGEAKNTRWPSNSRLIRRQFRNHLKSSSLEIQGKENWTISFTFFSMSMSVEVVLKWKMHRNLQLTILACHAESSMKIIYVLLRVYLVYVWWEWNK